MFVSQNSLGDVTVGGDLGQEQWDEGEGGLWCGVSPLSAFCSCSGCSYTLAPPWTLADAVYLNHTYTQYAVHGQYQVLGV